MLQIPVKRGVAPRTDCAPNLATAKAADSDKLDGIDSTGFLGATAKAADSGLLDGKDSTAFLVVNPNTPGNVNVRMSTSAGADLRHSFFVALIC
jgi:hypothetical protein